MNLAHFFKIDSVIKPQQVSKRSLPPIPTNHNEQQRRAYDVLRKQWQKHYDDSLEDVRTVRNVRDAIDTSADAMNVQKDILHVQQPPVRQVEGRPQTEIFKESQALSLKRHLPKPPPISPLVFHDSGVASLEEIEDANNKIVPNHPTYQNKSPNPPQAVLPASPPPDQTVTAKVARKVEKTPTDNFLWVGFEDPGVITRRPKNHDRLSAANRNDGLSSGTNRNDASSKKRHSAPPGTLDFKSPALQNAPNVARRKSGTNSNSNKKQSMTGKNGRNESSSFHFTSFQTNPLPIII